MVINLKFGQNYEAMNGKIMFVKKEREGKTEMKRLKNVTLNHLEKKSNVNSSKPINISIEEGNFLSLPVLNCNYKEKIEPFRFIGNKYSLLKEIDNLIYKENIQGRTFFDIFSGSGSVGRYFKDRFQIFSNDTLYFSYVIQNALIVLNEYPRFENIKIPNLSNDPKKRINQILEFLNNIEGVEGFIFNHYTPASKNIDGIERKYFSEENGKKIDAIRSKVEEWYNKKEINENEYFYLITSLLIAVQKIANISGTYGAFNKSWDPRSLKPLKLRFIELIPSRFNHQAFNCDAFYLIDKISCDIAYIDPPYNERQYIANYHLLETIAKYDNPKISGKTGIRNYSIEEKSTFCSKKTVDSALLKLLTDLKTKYVIMSYNSEGLLSKDRIIDLFEEAGIKNIKFYEFTYRRFKSSNISKNSKVKEYIFIGEKT